MYGVRVKSVARTKQLVARVNGQAISAYQGETVLAALLAAGYVILTKDPRSGDPRGAFCGMSVCQECLVTINGMPNVRSCSTEIEDGMEIETHGAR